MKILLIQPPHYYGGKSRTASFFPRALGHIAKILLDSGHTVKVLDIYAHQYKDEEVIRKLKETDYDVAGISAMSTQYNYAKWLAFQLKSLDKNKKIIVGGALATFSPRVVLENTDIDMCVIGEGENTAVELFNNLENPDTVKGVSFKRDGQIITTPPREYIKDLDTIGFPAYDLFPMDIYFKNSLLLGFNGVVKLKTANIICGRGCPFNCNFCSRVFKGLRLRSVDNIIGEIKYLKEKYQIEGIFFNDDTIIVNKQRMHELCDKILPLNLKWNCQGRVNNVDMDLLLHMKTSGCMAVGYGIESGSQKILNNMNKRVTVKRAEEAIRDTVKAGLYPIIQLMFGYPGETKETIQETIDFFKRVDNPGDELTPVTPLPGTQLWDYTLENKLIKDEKTLLENLDGGYMPDASVLVNYTDFSAEEFNFLRKNAAETMKKNYFQKHPVKLIENYYFRLKNNIRELGWQKTIKKIVSRFILKN